MINYKHIKTKEDKLKMQMAETRIKLYIYIYINIFNEIIKNINSKLKLILNLLFVGKQAQSDRFEISFLCA